MLNQLQALPSDPLLGLIAAFQNDTNENKVDLGVGVYKDEKGHTAIMTAIQKAIQIHQDTELSKTYLSPVGVPGFIDSIQQLVFSDSSSAVNEQRISGLQTPGGCGALRIGAELLVRTKQDLTVWLSNPSWANHIPLIKSAGLKLGTYDYFDTLTGAVNFQAMDDAFAKFGANDVVLLHGCCHNPTGADLKFEHWQRIAERANKQGFMPFVDLAYQGLDNGLDEDVKGLRYLSENVEDMLVATSCSKNFGLYRERTGSLLFQTASTANSEAVLSQAKEAARSSYSMSPAYGGFLVDIVLNNSDLRTEWETELNSMAKRIKDLRQGLLAKIEDRGISQDFSFITDQKGMFTYLGISKEQVHRMKNEFSIYMADSSRINVAGLNTGCLDYVADALSTVLEQ